ncbi:MAG TPA: CoA transferase, partial [Polyangiales bacterium]
HFYETYATKDGKFMAVGAIEPQFYAQLLKGMEIDPATLPAQMDRSKWPELKLKFAEIFKQKTRDEWTKIFAGTDACVAPILSIGEAKQDEHMRARGTFVDVGGFVQPGPAPRFSATPNATPTPPARAGANTDEVLSKFSFAPDEIAKLREAGAIV